MAFGITVHRRSDDGLFQAPPANVYSEEFDRWIKDVQARWLYENPLGAGGTVFDWWHKPAHEIGLPLVGAIYNEGLRVTDADLDRLSRELDALERFWDGADLSQELRDHLQESLGYLREAIRIALECDGILVIS